MTVLHMSKLFPGAIYQQSHVGSHREIEKSKINNLVKFYSKIQEIKLTKNF